MYKILSYSFLEEEEEEELFQFKFRAIMKWSGI